MHAGADPGNLQEQGAQVLTFYTRHYSGTSKEQPHAITRPRTQVRIETTMTCFSSPQSALAIENNLPERTATPRISRKLLLGMKHIYIVLL